MASGLLWFSYLYHITIVIGYRYTQSFPKICDSKGLSPFGVKGSSSCFLLRSLGSFSLAGSTFRLLLYSFLLLLLLCLKIDCIIAVRTQHGMYPLNQEGSTLNSLLCPSHFPSVPWHDSFPRVRIPSPGPEPLRILDLSGWLSLSL